MDKCIVISIKHTRASDARVTVWQSNNSGYTEHLSEAGQYNLSSVFKHIDYYNCGYDNIAIPLEIAERLAKSGSIPNTPLVWKIINASAVAMTLKSKDEVEQLLNKTA